MPATWKTVRVFISSTFRDMHAERDHLVRVVFPALRERLERHRIYLIDIDLRWGVTREQAENDQVLDLCLQQIDECRPFFIGILGQRYGWVPTRYPTDALKKFGWIQQHTGKSVTELEILHGVLQNRQMHGRAFFSFRDPVPLCGAPEALRQDVFADTDPQYVRKLEDLKQQIRYSGYPVMENYPARWDPEAYDRPSRSHGRLVGLEAFGNRVRDQLWQAIQEELQLPEQPPVVTDADPLEEEQDYHERFRESRLRVYVGREQLNDALLAFADGNDLVPCLVTGPSGSGKSAALARFVRDYQHKQPQTLVIPHFIGASPRSTNLRDMLRRFCQVLKAHFGFAEDVPEETARLSGTFREFVGKVPADTRVLLVIDALNQLDEADRAQELYWLPTELPPQVKVIASCITDSGKTEPVLEAFGWRKHCPVQLAALSDAERREIIRQVPSLSAKTLDDDQVRLLLSNPATANPLFLLVALEELRGFAPYERLNERIAAFPREGDTVTAIFTQVIERLTEEFNQKLVETVLTLLASARRGLSERELEELVGGLDGADDLFPVLRQLRPYLLSRAGLIDFYHRNLFKAVRERYLPSEEQQRQAHARLAEYFHAQDFWLDSLGEQQKRARALPPTPRPANVRKVDELLWQRLQAGQMEECARLLSNWMYLEAKTTASLVYDLVQEFDVPMESLVEKEVSGLQWFLRLLSRAFFPWSAPRKKKNLVPWQSFIRSQAPVLAVHPELFFQQAFNEAKQSPMSLAAQARRTQQRDAWVEWLNRPKKFSSPACLQVLFGHTKEVTAVSVTADGHLAVSGSRDQTIRVWDLTTGKCLHVLQGHTEDVTAVSVTEDGRRAVSGSADKTVRVWDLAAGQCLQTLPGHESEVNAVSVTGDGRRAVSGSADKTVRVWDLTTGHCILVLQGHRSYVYAVSVTPDGRHAVSGSSDESVRVWDLATGQSLHTLPEGQFAVTAVSVTEDGHRAVSGSNVWVMLWDLAMGRYYALWGHLGVVSALSITGDGRRAVSGSSDKTVRVWDLATRLSLYVLRGHESKVNAVSVTRDGCRAVSGSDDRTVRVWDLSSQQRPLTPQEDEKLADMVKDMQQAERVHMGYDDGVEDSVYVVRISGDGRRAVSFSAPGTGVGPCGWPMPAHVKQTM